MSTVIRDSDEDNDQVQVSIEQGPIEHVPIELERRPVRVSEADENGSRTPKRRHGRHPTSPTTSGLQTLDSKEETVRA